MSFQQPDRLVWCKLVSSFSLASRAASDQGPCARSTDGSSCSMTLMTRFPETPPNRSVRISIARTRCGTGRFGRLRQPRRLGLPSSSASGIHSPCDQLDSGWSAASTAVSLRGRRIQLSGWFNFRVQCSESDRRPARLAAADGDEQIAIRADCQVHGGKSDSRRSSTQKLSGLPRTVDPSGVSGTKYTRPNVQQAAKAPPR